MSEAVVSGLLSPEGVILKDPVDVDQALTSLWEVAGHEPDSQAGPEAKTRVCMANLVLVARAGDWNDLSIVLADLAREYPTRTLVLLLDDPSMAGRGPGQVIANVSSVCHIPQPGRPQVCCEQVVLRTASADGAGLDRVILPLIASDVPLLAWWTVDPAACGDLLTTMRQSSDRLIFDAGLAGFGGLPDAGRCVTRELGWFRSYRWRELVAQLFDEAEPETIRSIESVTLTFRGGAAMERIDAVWMVSFMAGQLGWTTGRVLGPGHFEFHSATGDLQVVLRDQAGSGEGLVSFEVRAGNSHFAFARCREGSDEFRIMISDEKTCRMPRSVQIRRRERADSLAVALTGRAVDLSFDRAAPLAAWMAQAIAS